MNSGLRPGENLGPFEMICDLDQRICGDDLDVGAGPGRLRAAGGRTNQSLVARIRADRGGKDSGHGRDRTVEAEFPEHRKSGQGASEGMAPIAAIRPSAIGRS